MIILKKIKGGGLFMLGKSYYGYGSSSSIESMIGSSVWLIIALVLAIVGGILVYFLFLSKKNEGKFKGFLGWLYDFLSFKKMFLEALLKITYLILAIYVTLSSFALIGTNFFIFLLVLILGNVLVRVIYEFSLILLVICRNTTDIAKNTSKKWEDKPEEKE